MTTDETPGDDTAATGSDSSHGRRRFVQLSGAAITAGIAGCSSLGLGTDDDPEDETSGDDAPGSTPANRGNETEESSATETETETETAADESEDATETDVEDEEDVHEHGYLYLEIDGERQPFTDRKYHQPGEHEDAEATDRFHFHDDGHDHLWHMHGQRLTLAGALGELPDVEYASDDGTHVVHFEGETYEDREGTSVEIRRGEEPIDPAGYELRDGDEIWIEIATGDGS